MTEVHTQPVDEADTALDKDLIMAHLNTGNIDVDNLTPKVLVEQLKEKHGREFAKGVVREVLNEFIIALTKDDIEAIAVVPPQQDQEESEGEEEEATAPAVEYPPEWQARFDDVVWVRTNKKWPWYAAIITDPRRLDPKPQDQAIGLIGKKHAILYYEPRMIAFASDNEIRPYGEHKEALLEEVRREKRFASHVTPVDAGALLADQDIALDKPNRYTSTFPIRVARKRGRKKGTTGTKKIKIAEVAAASKPVIKPKKSSSTVAGFIIPTPSLAPAAGVAISSPAVVEKTEKTKKVAAVKSAPVVKKRKPSAESAPKAVSCPTAPPKKDKANEGVSESDGEAECDFDHSEQEEEEGDDDYVEEGPKKKKQKSSSNGDAIKSSKKEEKVGSRKVSGEKKEKPSSSSGSTKRKTESTKNKKKASTPAAKTAPQIPLSVSKATNSKLPQDETTEMRARRMIGLLSKCGNDEKQSGPSAGLKEKTLKYLDKLQQMQLTMAELKSTGAADVISQWRKHGDKDIATKAKTVRQIWKEHFQKEAEAAGPGPTTPAPVATLEVVVKPVDVAVVIPEAVGVLPATTSANKSADVDVASTPAIPAAVMEEIIS